ncbi:capsule biosynthesis protein CapC [Escherichia coli]|nr:Stealth CR1 domain-containing protein [Kluyvera cryocrescens]EFH6525606.1 capsule biosynthesis protein CapC [Escherichia coli]EFL9897309.1 capsule biosynthesis protein CapC [Escherichia coli]EFN5226851.1 capsule biosynthesis protein CapC [Escherichia coli]EHP3501083.1 stealth conserved region 3 domain-containing protein [Escherichia coli]EIT7483367.1 stealth conserved region 3 domain-containing protein [Escherichia coli]
MRKIRKFFKNPGIFFRDHLNKRYPVFRNEILCREEEESILMRHDLAIEEKIIVNFPVDVVFTWVDDKDPIWVASYNHSRETYFGDTGLHGKDPSRFSNHDELKYSLRCVIKYLPWVRNIFIVTDNQRPAWLDINYDKRVKIIDHREIIPEKYLPTFNSHVIEAHLHRIKDLAEHFIYFNDDVFVARPLPVGHFFKNNGNASLFVSQKSLNTMHKKGIVTPTLKASLRGRKLLARRFNGELLDSPLVHTYVPLRKSLYHKCWEAFEYDITSFLSNKFRSDNDLNLATFLVPWFAYLDGSAILARDICYYFNIRSPAAAGYFNALEASKKNNTLPHSFCANDFNTKDKSANVSNEKIKLTLQQFFSSENQHV